MMLQPHTTSLPEAYRFVVRVTGDSLPGVDKALRLRCTLSDEDHSLVGVSATVVHLGTSTAFDELIEFVHGSPQRQMMPPKYYALTASMAPITEPGLRLRRSNAPDWTYADSAERRIAGVMDPATDRVEVPTIVLGES